MEIIWQTVRDIAPIVGPLATTVMAFVALAGLVFTRREFRKTLDITNKIEMVRLAREMTKEFYSDDPIFRDIRMAIESKKKLYKGHGGKFDHDQINRYLGFFDDLGFYCRIGSLTEDIINQLFGAYIIEAYLYPPIKEYMRVLRVDMEHKNAFADFEHLARTLGSPEKWPKKQKQVRKIREFFQEPKKISGNTMAQETEGVERRDA